MTQVAVIVLGILLIAKSHKVMRGLMGESGWYIEHTQLSLRLIDYGAALLLIPLLWIFIAAFFNTHVRAAALIRLGGVVIGIALFCLMFFGTILCFRTPLLISVPLY